MSTVYYPMKANEVKLNQEFNYATFRQEPFKVVAIKQDINGKLRITLRRPLVSDDGFWFGYHGVSASLDPEEQFHFRY